MDIKKFLKDTYEIVVIEVKTFSGERKVVPCGQVVRPHIVCNDGFRMSVQAGDGLYSIPRENLEDGNYQAVEIGFPNAEESLIMEYADNPKDPTDTVYGWVPIEVVEKVLLKHGGIKELVDPKTPRGGMEK